jgi:hypothetical protein
MIFRKKMPDPDKPKIYGMHPGDLGIVAVAVVITVVFFVMLLTPKDFAALDRALAPAAPKPKIQEDRGTPGVTTMQLYDAKKK